MSYSSVNKNLLYKCSCLPYYSTGSKSWPIVDLGGQQTQYAGLRGDFYAKQDWKKLRRTAHDHNPVNDAIGNVEAFERLLQGER